MKDIDSSTKNFIINNLVNNVLEITVYNEQDVPYMTITEENIVSESMVLKQSICDESDLKFGGCIASEFNIDLINTESRVFSNDLAGKQIIAVLKQTFTTDTWLYPKSNLYPSSKLYPGKINDSKLWYLFRGRIDSAERDQNNKNIRHIVAYDAFATMYQMDATNILYDCLKNSAKFGTILKSCVPIKISDNVDDILNTVIINENIGLTLNDMPIFNDDWLNSNETISKGDIVRMCCEMIGGFGVIVQTKTSAVFDIIFFNGSNEYGPNFETYDFYEELYNEEYVTSGYNYFVYPIGGNDRNEKTHKVELDTGTTSTERVYDLSDNILCWQKYDGTGYPSSSNTTILNLISSFSGTKMFVPRYTPLSAKLDGRLWVECGDRFRIVINQTDTEGNYVYDEDGNVLTEKVKSYVLSRTLTGIKALTDEIEAKGV